MNIELGFMKKIATLLLSIIFSLCFIELFFIVLNPQEDVYIYEYKDDLFFNKSNFSNPFALITKPQWKVVTKNDRYKACRSFMQEDEIFEEEHHVVSLETNHLGGRLYETIDSEVKVLNLGDSIGLGFPLEENETYVAEMQRQGISVNDCSYVAANTASLTKLYNKKCSKVDHDYVVLQMTIGVPGFRMPDYISTDRFGADIRLISALYAMGKQDELLKNYIEYKSKSDMIQNKVLRNFEEELQGYFRPRLNFYHSLHIVRFIEHKFYESKRGFMSLVEFSKNVGIKKKHNLEPTKIYIDRLNSLVEKLGKKLIVVMIPNMHGFCHYKNNGRKDIDRFEKFLRLKKIPYINFYQRVKDKKLSELFMTSEFHPNQKFHQLIGNNISKLINSNQSEWTLEVTIPVLPPQHV